MGEGPTACHLETLLRVGRQGMGLVRYEGALCQHTCNSWPSVKVRMFVPQGTARA